MVRVNQTIMHIYICTEHTDRRLLSQLFHYENSLLKSRFVLTQLNSIHVDLYIFLHI